MSNCLVARKDDELFSMICAANSCARFIRFSAGTISLISPRRSSLFRAENPAGQQQIASLFFSHLPQKKCRNDRRNESDAHFRVAELRFWHGQGEIAKQCEPGSARDRRPVHCGNRYLGKFIKRAEQPDHGLRILQILLRRSSEQAFEIVQIHPRAKSLARAGQDQHDRIRLGDLVERAQQIVNQFEADGIALLGTVQRDGRDAAVVCELDVLINSRCDHSHE